MGRKGFGKTTTVRKLIFASISMNLVKGQYVYIIKSSSQENAYGHLKHFQPEEHTLRRILSTAKKSSIPRMIVFDDVSQNENFFRYSKAFKEMIYNARHYHFYIIISTHSFTLLNSSLRNTVDVWMFPTINNKYVRDYIKEVDPDMSRKELDLMALASSDPLRGEFNMIVYIAITNRNNWMILFG